MRGKESKDEDNELDNENANRTLCSLKLFALRIFFSISTKTPGSMRRSIDGGLSHPIGMSYPRKGTRGGKCRFAREFCAQGIEYFFIRYKCQNLTRKRAECGMQTEGGLPARNSTLFLSRDCTDTRGLRMRVRDTPYSSIPFLISSFFLTGSVSAYSREYFTGGSTRDQRFCIIHVYYYTRRVYMCTRMYVCKYAWVCV